VTAAEILATYLADLRAYATAAKGKAVLAKDPFHVLELLCQAPRGFLLVLGDDGDEAQVGEDDLVVDLQFSVAVAFNLGLKAEPGEALVEDRGDRPSLVALCDAVRERVMGLLLPPEETSRQAAYRGREPITTPDGVPLAAYRLRFRLTYAPDAIPARNPA
jgi:hypothetical protein